MNNLWNNQEAARFSDDLAKCVYISRLLGGDKSLVLHGGGNTSVKVKERNIFGEEKDILYVKGSGWDLATIEAAGFTPLRLQPLVRLTTLDTLSDAQWANALYTNVTDATAPAPSVETLIHALIPHKYVAHTHSEALLSIASTPSGAARLAEIYGDAVVIVPYARSGFPIAKLAATLFAEQAHERTIGMVLMNHGLVTFGATAREAYEHTIDLVTRAERYLDAHNAWHIVTPHTSRSSNSPQKGENKTSPLLGGTEGGLHELAHLRQEVSRVAGYPIIMATHTDAQCMNFVHRADLADISQRGPATPDHVLRTKYKPLLGAHNLQSFRADYERYYHTNAARTGSTQAMLDPAPRVILDPHIGICTIGRTARDAAITADIYRNTIAIILRATALERYQALPEENIFELEYWAAEQAKLDTQDAPPFRGEIALVTGAASGIGKACVEAFLRRGAAVVGLDINPHITEMFDRADYLGLRCDMTDESAVSQALETTVKTFGGLDMLVPNAGVFPPGRHIAELPSAEWRKVLQVNLDANLTLMREAYPLLKAAPRYGRVVIMGSRNVPAPGPGAAAYSASKAALTQMARVAALEWGVDGIRVNIVNPHAVFDTGIWTEEVLRARAAHYGLTVEQYKKNNVLQTEVTSRDVGELVAEMCGPLFARTTGAQVPIDGGSNRVI